MSGQSFNPFEAPVARFAEPTAEFARISERNRRRLRESRWVLILAGLVTIGVAYFEHAKGLRVAESRHARELNARRAMGAMRDPQGLRDSHDIFRIMLHALLGVEIAAGLGFFAGVALAGRFPLAVMGTALAVFSVVLLAAVIIQRDIVFQGSFLGLAVRILVLGGLVRGVIVASAIRRERLETPIV